MTEAGKGDACRRKNETRSRCNEWLLGIRRDLQSVCSVRPGENTETGDGASACVRGPQGRLASGLPSLGVPLRA